MTQEQQRQYNESARKCSGLFETYVREKNNPAYAERYYFYSLYKNCMIYIDGTPRHHGKRQAEDKYKQPFDYLNLR